MVRDQVRDKLDFAFEDGGEQQVKNIARPVRVFRVHLGEVVTAAPRPPPLPEKPSLAVLPFQNMTGDPEQEYADGMVEEIITALSRIHWLFVIARTSSFTYKGQATDVKRVGRGLGGAAGRQPPEPDRASSDQDRGPADRVGGTEAAARHPLTDAAYPKPNRQFSTRDHAPVWRQKRRPGPSPVRFLLRNGAERPAFPARSGRMPRHLDWLAGRAGFEPP